MRIAYLECFSGVSGDMFLGALLDAGVPARVLEETVAALQVGARLEISRVVRSGISATKVDVWVDGEKDMPREEYWEKKGHEHAHGHSHDGGHGHEDHAGEHHGHEHSHPHGRGLTEIREIIGRSGISETAKKTAIAIFEALGAAEAKIHNTPVEKIHFHEVGAVDAIVDIVCAAVGAEALGVDEIVCSSLNVGGGTVNCAHGTFPVPAPATLELLKDAPLYSSGVQAELVTPTGAAIVKTLARRFAAFPEMKIEKSGYGAGSRDFPGHPNVLRLTIGEAASTLAAKTDRPGSLLTVLCKPEDAGKLTQLIFTETTTLGVRRRDEMRQTLARRWENVHTKWGEVRIKIASMNGTITNYAAEYEDCRRIATEHRVPLKTVMQEAARAYVESGRK